MLIMVTYLQTDSLVPPKWVKSNAWRRESEERKLVLTMASYASDYFGPGIYYILTIGAAGGGGVSHSFGGGLSGNVADVIGQL